MNKRYCKMLKYLSFITFLCITSFLFAQQNSWQYNRIEDAYGKNIYLYHISSTQKELIFNTALLYNENGKYVKYKKSNDNLVLEEKYTVGGPYENKKQQLVRLSNSNQDFFLPIETAQNILLNMLRVDFFDSLYTIAKTSGDYINMTKYNSLSGNKPDIHDRNSLNDFLIYDSIYSKIIWIGYSIGTNAESPVPINIQFKTNGGKKQEISYSGFNTIRPCLISEEKVKQLKEKQEREIEEQRLREIAEQKRQDSIRNCGTFLAHLKYTSTVKDIDNKDVEIDTDDTLAVYNYIPKQQGYSNDGCCSAIVNGHFVEIRGYKFGYVEFYNSNDKSYLTKKGKEGEKIRLDAAVKYDSLCFERRLASLEKMLYQIDSIKNEWVKKGIFLYSLDYAYSDYQFGLEFSFFNCFKKTIKYIDITTVAYNQVGDEQKDYFGSTTKKVHCIGPIEPKDDGVFVFDEMFWDEYDVIEYLRVTYIKFTFMDNSVQVYSGWNNIKKHIK